MKKYYILHIPSGTTWCQMPAYTKIEAIDTLEFFLRTHTGIVFIHNNSSFAFTNYTTNTPSICKEEFEIIEIER